jgi:hypothetical protein
MSDGSICTRNVLLLCYRCFSFCETRIRARCQWLSCTSNQSWLGRSSIQMLPSRPGHRSAFARPCPDCVRNRKSLSTASSNTTPCRHLFPGPVDVAALLLCQPSRQFAGLASGLAGLSKLAFQLPLAFHATNYCHWPASPRTHSFLESCAHVWHLTSPQLSLRLPHSQLG